MICLVIKNFFSDLGFDFFENSFRKKYSVEEFKDEFEDEFEDEIEEDNKNIFSRLSKTLILLIEDDYDMRRLLSQRLKYSGFDVLKADDGIKGQALAIEYSPDLILLDNFDGSMLCQRLGRDERTSNIPILRIINLSFDKLKDKKFNWGADDYIEKPFDYDELYVRIEILLRRTNRAQLNTNNKKEILHYGPLSLIPERFAAIWFESLVRLTPLEFKLLHCLLQRHGQPVSLSLIQQAVWGYELDDHDIGMIRVHVRKLRTKLEKDPRKPFYIKTNYGKGYCLLLD